MRIHSMQAEYQVASPKSISKKSPSLPLPPLRVAALNIKIVPEDSGKAQEIIAASVVHTTMHADGPTDTATWQQCRNMSRLSVLRRLEGASWPSGLLNAVKVCHTSSIRRVPPNNGTCLWGVCFWGLGPTAATLARASG
jgi:hypothetical protein